MFRGNCLFYCFSFFNWAKFKATITGLGKGCWSVWNKEEKSEKKLDLEISAMHAIPTKISQVPPPLSQTKFIYFACQEHFSCLFTDDSSYYFKGQLKTSSITRSTTHMHQTNTNTCYSGRRRRVIKCRPCFFFLLVRRFCILHSWHLCCLLITC